MDTSAIKTLKTQLAQPKRIVLIPHKNPDGDAIGSCLGLYLYLKKTGHEVVVVSPNAYPDFLKWMPGQEEIIHFDQAEEEAKTCIAKADFIFTLDFNHFSRVGDMEEVLEKATADFVMIDHHQQPADYAAFMESNTQMSSTCEMVYHFIVRLGAKDHIDTAIATCLYTGIMTDTGSFRFASTTSETHRVIAQLIDYGAKNAAIHQAIYDASSYNRLQLLGVALQNLKIHPEAKTAYITLSQEELDKHHFQKGDTEGFVNYALSVEGVVFAAIFIENKANDIIKISLRSKGNFDVNQVARTHFQGGGHRNASGGKSDEGMEETVKKFVNLLQIYKTDLAQN